MTLPRYKRPNKVSRKQRQKIAARKKIRERWWKEGKRTCGICGRPITNFYEMTNDHIIPGSGKDDTEANQQPAHVLCNGLKGSKRNYSRANCLRDLGIC